MELNKLTKKYSNDEITIVWKPGMCIHSTNCWKKPDSLRSVFDPAKKPWINPEGATTEAIIAQIEQCPSGALSYYRNGETPAEKQEASETKIEIAADGPLLVHGSIVIQNPDGTTENRENKTALCRCGASANKPFCDGTHRKIDFKG